MKDSNDIVFDLKSGISMEDQKEILSKIDGLAEAHRLSLTKNGAVGGGEKRAFEAQKKGGSFPLAVNIAALALLAAGLFALSFFQGAREADIREAALPFDSAERAMIEEIRRETALLLAAKDIEINRVLLRLTQIEDELNRLQPAGDALTAQQIAAQNLLLAEHQEYSAARDALQDERAQLLEESRLAQSLARGEEAPSLEAAFLTEFGGVFLTAAGMELRELTSEQQLEMAIEAHLNGGIALARDLIRENRFDEAREAVGNLRAFMNTPAFERLRFLSAMADFYNMTLDSLEALAAAEIEVEPDFAAGGEDVADDADVGANALALADLQTRNAQLEEALAAMNMTVAALGADGAGQTQRLIELEASLSAIQSQNTTLQTSIAGLQTSITEREQSIAALESDRASLNSALAARDSTINEQVEEIATLNTELTQIRAALQTILGTN